MEQVIQVKEICATSLPVEQQNELIEEAKNLKGFIKVYRSNDKWYALINTRIAEFQSQN